MPYDAPAEAGTKKPAQWIEMIERYERGSQEWRERSEKIVKIYLDQHRTQSAPRRFAILWSNIETLKPAVYARLPVAVVSRRYKDPDPTGRKASEVLERCINTTFDLYGLDEIMQLVRDDRLLTSRGSAWVRYESEIDDKDNISSERVICEYVHWADFGHSMNRTWPEVTTVWRRVYMTRKAVEKRWDKETADKLNYEVRPEYAMRGNEIKDATEPQAVIYEIWDRPTNKAIWLAKEEKITLEEGKPPLKFRDFFPCPKPIYGSKATGSLIPTPDYRYYQDQAEEIDDLTQKIADLTGWLRLKGFYAGGPSSEGADAIEELLRLEGNQVLVKVESWAGFAERGGVKGLIEWIPLEVIVTALREAVTTRTQLINDVYQISGISDILRGETDPDETLGAQEIKAQTGTRRQAPAQREVARFARDLAEMVGEVISEVFQPQTMTDMSGMDMTVEEPPELAIQMQTLMQQMQLAQSSLQEPGAPQEGAGVSPSPPLLQQAQQQLQQLQQQQQQIQLNKEVLALLRDEKTRGFRIEIETDSTIEPDEQAEKQRRIEFLAAVGDFIQRVTPTVQLMPEMGPLVGEMMMFMVRGFRAGRTMEDVIEQTMQKLNEKLANPPPPPPDPKVEAEKVKLQGVQQKAEMDQQSMQQKAQLEQQKGQMEMQMAQQKAQLEMQKLQMEMQKMQAEMQIAMQELGIKKQAAEIDAHMQERKAQTDAAMMDKQAEHEERSNMMAGEAMERKHDLGMEAMEAKAKQAKPNGARK